MSGRSRLEARIKYDNEQIILKINKLAKKLKKQRVKIRKGDLATMSDVNFDRDGIASHEEFGISFSKAMVDNCAGLLKTKPGNARGLSEYANKSEAPLYKTGCQLIERG